MTTKPPYSLIQNDPVGGGSWESVTLISRGKEYDIADGSMTKKYALFTPPTKGLKGKLWETDTLTEMSVDDVLVWINFDGMIRSALDPNAMLAAVERAATANPNAFDADRPRVGPALRCLRESTGLTLREFSERAGFDHAFVSRVERDVFRPKASWLESYLETAGEALADATAKAKA